MLGIILRAATPVIFLSSGSRSEASLHQILRKLVGNGRAIVSVQSLFWPQRCYKNSEQQVHVSHYPIHRVWSSGPLPGLFEGFEAVLRRRSHDSCHLISTWI